MLRVPGGPSLAARRRDVLRPHVLGTARATTCRKPPCSPCHTHTREGPGLTHHRGSKPHGVDAVDISRFQTVSKEGVMFTMCGLWRPWAHGPDDGSEQAGAGGGAFCPVLSAACGLAGSRRLVGLTHGSGLCAANRALCFLAPESCRSHGGCAGSEGKSRSDPRPPPCRPFSRGSPRLCEERRGQGALRATCRHRTPQFRVPGSPRARWPSSDTQGEPATGPPARDHRMRRRV